MACWGQDLDLLRGRITVDGLDLRSLSPKAWHKEISVILQDYVRYSTTVRDNIWFGDISQPPHLPRIINAAECSGASEFICDLDDGYNTVLGRQFDNGIDLSVGQWQKIALSRAFMNPSQIIVLDEPTSSLDPSAEDQVLQRFQLLVQDKTAIIISHRLSTVRLVDCIYFMKQGRIIERGRHDELMELGGEYARLFQIQAQHYR